MSYRQLTKEELKSVFAILQASFSKSDGEHQNAYRDFVKKYYPASASYALVNIDSEYNDNTYDNSISYVAVFDENGDEILPLKATADEARRQWRSLPCPTESLEPVEDKIVVPVKNTELPKLYIKEN